MKRTWHHLLFSGGCALAARSVARFCQRVLSRQGANGAKSSGGASGNRAATKRLNAAQESNAAGWPTRAAKAGSRSRGAGIEKGKSKPTTRAGSPLASVSASSAAVQPGCPVEARTRALKPSGAIV